MTTIARALSTTRRAAFPLVAIPSRTLLLLAVEVGALSALSAATPLPRVLALAARLLLSI